MARAVLLPRAPAQLCGYFGVVPNGYATYVAPIDRLPPLLRTDGVARVDPVEPAHCWPRPWADAVTGKGWN